uniref:NUMOD3 domain-containing DNA-binding protein n=1 Tax=Rhodococcus marinonascens TaxID=38311 RepID=UPI0035A21CCC
MVSRTEGFEQWIRQSESWKVRESHPSFGHVISEESRLRLSERRRGAGNPNFGQRASEETRAKMSAVRRGRPMPSSKRNALTRHHTNKGAFKGTCQYCIEDAAKTNDE